MNTHFQFLDTEEMQEVKILAHVRQGLFPVYLIVSIPQLLMTWWGKKPDHQTWDFGKCGPVWETGIKNTEFSHFFHSFHCLFQTPIIHDSPHPTKDYEVTMETDFTRKLTLYPCTCWIPFKFKAQMYFVWFLNINFWNPAPPDENLLCLSYLISMA